MTQSNRIGRPLAEMIRRKDLHGRLVKAAHELIQDCTCDIGCPGCVGPAGEQGPDAKGHALAVLKALQKR